MDVGGCIWVWVYVDVYQCGGMWMYMNVGGPPKYGLGTPQYGDYVPTFRKNDIFCQNDVFFPLGRSNWLQITKNNFLRFLAFYPLISAFHALWRSSWRRTFRDLSFRIINSSFHAVWLDIRKSIENLTKIYRKSIENLSNIYRKSIENLSNIYRTSIENLSNIYRKSIEHLSNSYRKSIENRSKVYRNPYKTQKRLNAEPQGVPEALDGTVR